MEACLITIPLPEGFGYYQVQLLCGFAYTINVYTLQRTIPSVREQFFAPSLHRSHRKCWNINQLSIEYRSRLTLRPRLTLIRLSLIQETLVFRWAGFSPALSLLMPTFAFLSAPICLTTRLHCKENAPLPQNKFYPKLRYYI